MKNKIATDAIQSKCGFSMASWEMKIVKNSPFLLCNYHSQLGLAERETRPCLLFIESDLMALIFLSILGLKIQRKTL
jgi:hypothetical protein